MRVERRILYWTGGYGRGEEDPREAAPPPKIPKLGSDTASAEDFGPEQPRHKTSLMLGRFMPPHLGHQFVLNAAQAASERLIVLVRRQPNDPIDASLRAGWVRELAPGADVRVFEGDDPPAGAKPDVVAQHWAAIVRKLLAKAELPDAVFSSEPDVWRFARALGCASVEIDVNRDTARVWSHEIRDNPLKHWEKIPGCVRPYFVRRIALVGPPGSGKSTLAGQLAERLQTCVVKEFAREFMEWRGGVMQPGYVQAIARGQQAGEDALARQANRFLICDTDLAQVAIWCEQYFKRCPTWIGEAARSRSYALTLLLEPPKPEPRAQAFIEAMEARFKAQSRPYERLRGGWDGRLEEAFELVRRLP